MEALPAQRKGRNGEIEVAPAFVKCFNDLRGLTLVVIEGAHLLSESETEEAECFMAVKNPLFGVGVYMFFKVPSSWRLLKAPEPPECLALGKEVIRGEFRWVVSGMMRTILLNKEFNEARMLSVEVKEFRDGARAQSFVDKRFRGILGRNIALREGGSFDVCGHSGRYLLWAQRRRALFTGKERTDAFLDCAVYCDKTERLLWLKISSGNVNGLMRDKEAMLSILSSITCHE